MLKYLARNRRDNDIHFFNYFLFISIHSETEFNFIY